MKQKMRKWLTSRGLTAVRVADVAGIRVVDMYRQLNGDMDKDPALRETLCGIFGMTVQEFREAIP